MTEDKQTLIDFPGPDAENAPRAEFNKPGPQGVQQFYDAIQASVAAAFQVAAPFQGKHGALDNALGEVLRYTELASMYMDRFVMYINNPQLLARSEGEPDAES